MIHKNFSEGNYQTNDSAGKDVVKAFLRNHNVRTYENPDKYGIDLLAPRYEVERRTIYFRTWMYKTVHVPERKTKFLKYDIWYVVNVHHILEHGLKKKNVEEFDSLMFCKSDIIRNSPLVEVPNRSVKRGEYFYNVPIDEWKLFRAVHKVTDDYQ